MSVILSPRITLGEAIQKISTAIYYELIELLQIFNKISCEGLHVLFYIFFYDAITNYISLVRLKKVKIHSVILGKSPERIKKNE